MSPFWKNVTDELQYQGMNIKTLSTLTGIPYTTITNARNRSASIPAADMALKISRVLNKPIEFLLGESAPVNETHIHTNNEQEKLLLYQKYEKLIHSLEKQPTKVQEAFIHMAHVIS